MHGRTGRMEGSVDITRMTWVWVAEVVEEVDRRMRAEGISAGELACRAAGRFGVRAESFERQMRAARGQTGVMNVHTADQWLVLVGGHLTDLPTYRAALWGDPPPGGWPQRGRRRAGATVSTGPEPACGGSAPSAGAGRPVRRTPRASSRAGRRAVPGPRAPHRAGG